MILKRLISTLLASTLAILACKGQEVLPARMTKYTQKDGLSSGYITKIVQDQYGFLWAGTQEGLNVFDSKSFLILSKDSDAKRNIIGSLVQDMVEDTKRSLMWVQTSFAPICAFDLTTRTIHYAVSHDAQHNPYTEIWARSLGLQGDILWIGGLNTLSAYHIPSGAFLNTEHIESLLVSQGEYNINKITLDQLGNIWLMIDGYGTLVINEDLEIIQAFDLNKLETDNNKKLFFWDVKSTNGNIFAATSWGLIQFDIDENSHTININKEVSDILLNSAVTSIAQLSESKIWVASTDKVYVYDIYSHKIKVLLDQEGDQQYQHKVYQIHYDQKNEQVWLGTQSGLQSFTYGNLPFTAFLKSLEGKPVMNHLNSLFSFHENKIIAGGNDGVYQINPVTTQLTLLDSTKLNYLLFRGKENQIYVSSDSKNYILKGVWPSDTSQVNPLPSDLVGNPLGAAINYNDSLILLSSFVQKGLTVWNTADNQTITFHPDSLNSQIPDLQHINNLYKGSDHFVYILAGQSIIVFNPLDYNYKRYIIVVPSTNETLSNFMDMNESPDSYFIGTYGDGLVETDKQFNVKRIYTTEDGLSNNCIYRIFNVKDEKMLMTTNNGLSILDLKTKQFKNYYEGDGLHGNSFEQFCGYQKDNKIYVGGPGGFTIVNTDLLRDSSNIPILYPTGIEINTPDGIIDSTHLEMSSFTIPNDAFKTTLKFVSPDYKNPDRMTYRYKIDELSDEWVELGNQNFVDLIGVNPGEYHFEVIATNSEGTDSKPLKMTLDFLPKWFQTTSFKVLLLLLVAGLVYWVQRYRMNQIKKQQTIRKEIANDLHDDIGSTLNSLKIFAHLAQSDTNNKGHIEQIEESISEATVGLRDMIWVLEDEQDSVYEIMERIKKFASPICMANYIEFVGTVNATSEKSIPKKIKRNIFLVAKECINNSVKYAECSRIEVALAYSKSKLQLTIEDNGKGFDYDGVTKGKGLDSMEYRANQVQFNCNIQSRIGSGTITTIQGTIG